MCFSVTMMGQSLRTEPASLTSGVIMIILFILVIVTLMILLVISIIIATLVTVISITIVTLIVVFIRFGGEGPELAVLDSTDLMCPGKH